MEIDQIIIEICNLGLIELYNLEIYNLDLQKSN